MDFIKKAKEAGYIIRDNDLEHRLVYVENFGPIPTSWVVHHINEIKHDNRPENLIALPRKFHTGIHRTQYKCNIRFTKEQLTKQLDNWLKGKLFARKNREERLKKNKAIPKLNTTRMTNKELLQMNGEMNRLSRKHETFSKKYNKTVKELKEILNYQKELKSKS